MENGKLWSILFFFKLGNGDKIAVQEQWVGNFYPKSY